jgi:hypothetical protein
MDHRRRWSHHFTGLGSVGTGRMRLVGERIQIVLMDRADRALAKGCRQGGASGGRSG